MLLVDINRQSVKLIWTHWSSPPATSLTCADTLEETRANEEGLSGVVSRLEDVWPQAQVTLLTSSPLGGLSLNAFSHWQWSVDVLASMHVFGCVLTSVWL